ncbi:MAG: glutathione peroxidase, partial [Phycisphaerae bacterium]
CGFTSQYNGLEKLNREYKEKGLAVIGFPCNQFGHQEPGSDSEIQQFCQMNYGVSFPVLAKIEVNGDAESPLFTWLKKSAPGMLGTEAIKWNFTKFLVDRKGNVLGRYAPQTKPEDIKKDIERALANV